MITLYGFGPGLGMYDPSPFVLKVAAFLRLANIDYRFNGNVNHVFKAPKKKLPYLDDILEANHGKEEQMLSYLIVKYKRVIPDNLAAHLDTLQGFIETQTEGSFDQN